MHAGILDLIHREIAWCVRGSQAKDHSPQPTDHSPQPTDRSPSSCLPVVPHSTKSKQTETAKNKRAENLHIKYCTVYYILYYILYIICYII